MSKERQKGTAWESDLVKALRGKLTNASANLLYVDHPDIADVWLNGVAPKVERTGSRAYELGDLVLPGWAVEAKNQKSMALAGWVDQATESAFRLDDAKPDEGPHLPVVIHKRVRRNVLESYCTLPLWAYGYVVSRVAAAEG